MHVCLLTSFLIAIPIPDKWAETIIQAYVQHVKATFNGFLTLIINNEKQFKYDLFQNVINELGINIIFQALTTHHQMTF